MDKTKKSEIVASLYLHEYKKDNGKQSLKIRVFHNKSKKRKYYLTDYEFTKNEFEKICSATNKKSNAFKIQEKLTALQNAFIEVAENVSPFSFDKFEQALNRVDIDSSNIISQYNETIKELKSNKQISTAENYRLSLKSFLNFELYRNGKESKTIPFEAISIQWLKDYESYMTNELSRSRTTVSIYLRTLRTIFNNAIFDKTISNEIYPFGKRKYQIPAPKGVKKALNKEQLKTLFEAEPQTSEQDKAKSFWFFSYFCNGMNIKDILSLRYKDISGETLTFFRAKTKSTQKEQKPIVVFLNDYVLKVIEKYESKEKSPENYVFDFIDRNKSPELQHQQIKNFVRYINQHFKKFASQNGIKENVSTYWARHSFATTAIRNGANMELLSESLGHENLKTTIGYFAGFETKTKKELAKKLMNF